MFFIFIVIVIVIIFLMIILKACHKFCQQPQDPPLHEDPQGHVPPPMAPLPALPSLPSGTIPVGLEPPPYSEVTEKPFLFPLPQGPCPECGHDPGAQSHFTTQTNF